MNLDEFSFFNQQLASMIRDGIPLEAALRQLSNSLHRGTLKSEISHLEADLAAGIPLDQAVVRRKLPEFYVQMLKIGARSNDLPGFLVLLADYYRRAGVIGTRLKGLMVYPVIVLICALALSVWFGTVFSSLERVLPGGPLQDLFAMQSVVNVKPPPARAPTGTRRPPPAAPVPQAAPASGSTSFFPITRRNVAGLRLMLWSTPLLLFLITATLALLVSSGSGRRWLRWRLPAFREASLAQFAASLGILLRGGIPLPDALGLVQKLERGSLAGKDVQLWLSKLAEGRGRFREMAAGSRTVPPLFLWLVNSAGDDLALGFERAAEVYQARSEQVGEVLLNAALPAALLLLGLMLLGQIYPFTAFIQDILSSMIGTP